MSGLAMTNTAEWNLDDLRLELKAQLHKHFSLDDMARIKSIDCANYIPQTVASAMELERRGLPKGAVVQIIIHVCRRSDGDSGRVARVEIPRLLQFRDIAKVAQALATPIAKALGQMDREAA